MKNKNLKFFLFDFDGNYFIEEVKYLKNIYFQTPIFSLLPQKNIKKCKITKIYPPTLKEYKKAFFEVIEEIKKGNTYLLNLTFQSKIETNCNLIDIFNNSYSPFKLYFKDKFVCFSPERFVKIKNDKIYTYPMKGTIEASIPNAKEKILSNIKEMAEHTMVVDLLRNDLGIIAKKVKVNKFRFISKANNLLQVSSKIEATMPPNWQKNWVDLIKKMLPAGSISGTPKKKTIETIKRIENYNRGFYTGIFGITDENTFLDSAVIIRYIEKKNENFYYKSGGGITIDSNLEDEYNELIKKIYIPTL